jgi:hypothetical protein
VPEAGSSALPEHSAEPGSGDWDGWLAVLIAMEQDLAAAVAESFDDESIIAPWTPPTGLGPLPAGLREHARYVLESQGEVIAHLEARRSEVGRHLGALRSVPTGAQNGNSPFLDVTG